MEILKNLETKVKRAVQEIETLRGRVKELEAIKAHYERKTEEILEEIDLLDLLEQAEAEENEASDDEQAFDNEKPRENDSSIFTPSM